MEKLSLKKRYSRLSVARKIRQHVAIPACRVLLISSGWRVIIAAMPPPNAYTAQTNAKTSAKEPNTSTANPPIPRRSRAPYLPHLHPARFGGARSGATLASGRCFILGSAFRLHHFGDKSSFRTGVTFDE